MRKEGPERQDKIVANLDIKPTVQSTREVIRHPHWLLLSRQQLLVRK